MIQTNDAAKAHELARHLGRTFANTVEQRGARAVEGHMIYSSSVGKSDTPDHFVMGSVHNGALVFSAEPEPGSVQAQFYDVLIKTFNDRRPAGVRAELVAYGAKAALGG